MKDSTFLDAIDLRILSLVLRDARMPYKAMAAEVELTSPACAERLRRLKEHGFIERFSARLNWSKLGYPITALIRIAAQADHGSRLVKLFTDTPNVQECYRVTGADSYSLKVLVASTAELERVLDRIGRHGTITTSMVLSTPILGDERAQTLLGRPV